MSAINLQGEMYKQLGGQEGASLCGWNSLKQNFGASLQSKMNLFCFSLEGSMDSLYEPVQEHQESKDTMSIDSRSSTPLTTYVKWGPPDRSMSLEFSDFENTLTKKRKSIQKSVSENEAFERKTVNGTLWQDSKKPENNSYIRRHCQLEELSENNLIGDSIHLLQGKKVEQTTCEVVNYEQWIPPQALSPSGSSNSEMVTESDDNKAESMGTLKRLQKLVRNKKANAQSLDDAKHVLIPLNSFHDINLSEKEDALTSCMKLTKSQEKKFWKELARQKEEIEMRPDFIAASLGRSYISRPNNFGDICIYPDTEFQLWSDWKPFPDNQLCPCDFVISKIEDWENCICCSHHSRVTCSLTDMDLSYSWRTSSFGTFDRFRHHSVSKPDDSVEVTEVETVSDLGDAGQNKMAGNGGGLGKKMRAISLTMKKKMGKKYIKALSEDTNEEGKDDSDPGGGGHTEKASLKASDSMDSLYSGQSSSSGVTSCSDGTSNRDSFRLDDEVPYTGPFCGRAKVHTDFTPSPYDTDSLKIKKGDIIDIICKTPMGMWTGMLNNKVGNFKFIYVDIIMEEEAAPRKIRAHRRSRRAKPKTLQELLERIHLQEYTSTLLLNGYETLEDLKDLQESHLVELNITDPEDRAKLLSAVENLQDYETEQEHENEKVPLSLSPDLSFNKSQLNDCPRDSGCYISSENSDNGKEELDPETLSNLVQTISITEPN
ncbi:SAM domain-containing protein SAMSN-1 isoform A [Alligator mississippiensis]|uniref:SAM domain-containing protein SAMSN-1 n=2 Tax=Alligator mississippiensis TaxID=8496 RepID=A0A151MDU7_ALLMI|nr:SAM domain-containing protein SAMSN-1 isoform A [Alligator mississippiensis]